MRPQNRFQQHLLMHIVAKQILFECLFHVSCCAYISYRQRESCQKFENEGDDEAGGKCGSMIVSTSFCWHQAYKVQILLLPCFIYLNLGKLGNIYAPPFCSIKGFMYLFLRIVMKNMLIHVIYLIQCLVHSKISISGRYDLVSSNM